MCTVHTLKKHRCTVVALNSEKKKGERLQETNAGAAAVRVKQQNIDSAAVKNACLRSKSILWLAATHRQPGRSGSLAAQGERVWGSTWERGRERGRTGRSQEHGKLRQNQTVVTNDRGRFPSPSEGLQQEPSHWCHHPPPAFGPNPPPQDAPR